MHGGNNTRITVVPVPPYDFGLCLHVGRSFIPDPLPDGRVLRTAVRIREQPAILEMREAGSDPVTLEIRTSPRLPGDAAEVKRTAEWIICADMEVLPFYRLAADHPILGPITSQLHGLKPLRPASLFAMLVIAVTEQQISLAAAYRIRRRIVERFGDQVNGLWAFPTPEGVRAASVADLMRCGLSRRKAEYVQGLASLVTGGELDLDRLTMLSDEEVRSLLLQVRGLGPWSVEYFLVRGLCRPDRVPAADLGIRSVVGRYLGRGQRLSPQGTMRKLSPFKPYRGLAAFYLLASMRLEKDRKNTHG